MPLIKLCRGIQGIGKSTYAKYLRATQKYVRVNKDEIRVMESGTYEDSNPQLVDDTMHGFIQAALKQGLNIVIDNTFCFQKHIDDIVSRYHTQADIEIVSFPNDLPRAIVQNSYRTGGAYIEPTIIKSFSTAYDKSTATLSKKNYSTRIDSYNGMDLLVYEIPKKIIKIHVPNASLTKTIVFDIDNTLAIKGDRDVYDFSKCGLDLPIESTCLTLEALNKFNLKIVFVTGRGEEARTETSQWIFDHTNINASYFNLFMRPYKDFRRDSIVKEEIYNNRLRDKFNVVGWFEDSQKVINEFLIPYKIPFFDTTYSQYS